MQHENDPELEELERMNAMLDENENHPKVEVEEPESYITFSKNFNNVEKMFSILAIKDEIYRFSERVGFGRLVDPESISFIVDSLKERLDYIQSNIDSGNYNEENYKSLLNAQLKREEQIANTAKKDYDQVRATNRKTCILRELDGETEVIKEKPMVKPVKKVEPTVVKPQEVKIQEKQDNKE